MKKIMTLILGLMLVVSLSGCKKKVKDITKEELQNLAYENAIEYKGLKGYTVTEQVEETLGVQENYYEVSPNVYKSYINGATVNGALMLAENRFVRLYQAGDTFYDDFGNSTTFKNDFSEYKVEIGWIICARDSEVYQHLGTKDPKDKKVVEVETYRYETADDVFYILTNGNNLVDFKTDLVKNGDPLYDAINAAYLNHDYLVRDFVCNQLVATTKGEQKINKVYAYDETESKLKVKKSPGNLPQFHLNADYTFANGNSYYSYLTTGTQDDYDYFDSRYFKVHQTPVKNLSEKFVPLGKTVSKDGKSLYLLGEKIKDDKTFDRRNFTLVRINEDLVASNEYADKEGIDILKKSYLKFNDEVIEAQNIGFVTPKAYGIIENDSLRIHTKTNVYTLPFADFQMADFGDFAYFMNPNDNKKVYEYRFDRDEEGVFEVDEVLDLGFGIFRSGNKVALHDDIIMEDVSDVHAFRKEFKHNDLEVTLCRVVAFEGINGSQRITFISK